VFVGPTYNKPKKQLKTKFYKQRNTLKPKHLEIEWNLEKKNLQKMKLKLEKIFNSLTLAQIVIPI